MFYHWEFLHISQFWRTLVSKTYKQEKRIGHRGFFSAIAHFPTSLFWIEYELVILVKMGYTAKNNNTSLILKRMNFTQTNVGV